MLCCWRRQFPLHLCTFVISATRSCLSSCSWWNLRLFCAENRSEELQVRLSVRSQLYHRQATTQSMSVLQVSEMSRRRHGQRRFVDGFLRLCHIADTLLNYSCKHVESFQFSWVEWRGCEHAFSNYEWHYTQLYDVRSTEVCTVTLLASRVSHETQGLSLTFPAGITASSSLSALTLLVGWHLVCKYTCDIC